MSAACIGRSRVTIASYVLESSWSLFDSKNARALDELSFCKPSTRATIAFAWKLAYSLSRIALPSGVFGSTPFLSAVFATAFMPSCKLDL